MRKFIDQYALYLAWLVAVCGFVASAYFGEVIGIDPCRLCWYQRMALFPLVIVLGIAAYKDDRHIVPYALPLAVFGCFFAVYQALGEQFPVMLGSSLCGHAHPCGDPVFALFGYVTLAAMSAAGFLAIILLLIVSRR
jgi:disulfide bond formation protein DsbB